MVSKVDISIIIPTYNEKNYLWDSVNRIKKVFKNLYNYEIIFVDSNSDDGSKNIFEAIKKENKNVKIIYQSCKKGIGSASFEGYLGSDGDFIMQIDGDCSHDPNDLLEMYKKIKNENYDMVIGSRYIEGG